MRAGGSFVLESEGDIGILAAFDCSEALPTFNAADGEVVPCIHHDKLDQTFDWVDGKILKLKGKAASEDSLTTFEKVFKDADVLFSDSKVQRPNDAHIKIVASDGSVCIHVDGCDAKAEFKLSELGLHNFEQFQHCYVQATAKLLLQLMSTVVFCQLGKIYQNIMIDVKTSNSKLLYRAIRSVSDVTGCDLTKARRCIVAATTLSSEVEDMPDDELIEKSAEMTQIVPSAVVMAISGCEPAVAFEKVRQRGRLCDIITNLLQSPK